MSIGHALNMQREDTMTCVLTARQRLAKQIPARANERNNTTSIARQRRVKHASSTIGDVFSVRPVQSGYKEVFGTTEQ
jgi:hypothetical protein